MRVHLSIACCGSDSTGKSTLLRQVAARHKDAVVVGGHLATQRDASIGSSRQTLEAYVREQFRSERQARSQGPEILLNETMLLDQLAHAYASRDTGLAQFTDDELGFFEEVAWAHGQLYDLIVLVPLPDSGDCGGARAETERYSAAVEAHLLKLLDRAGRDVLEVTGTVDERVRKLETWILEIGL